MNTATTTAFAASSTLPMMLVAVGDTAAARNSNNNNNSNNTATNKDDIYNNSINHNNSITTISQHHHHHHHTTAVVLLDVQILTTVLRRNQAAHGRTMYHRRCTMALIPIQEMVGLRKRQQQQQQQQQQQRSDRPYPQKFNRSQKTNDTTTDHRNDSASTISLYDNWNNYYQQTLEPLLLFLVQQRKKQYSSSKGSPNPTKKRRQQQTATNDITDNNDNCNDSNYRNITTATGNSNSNTSNITAINDDELQEQLKPLWIQEIRDTILVDERATGDTRRHNTATNHNSSSSSNGADVMQQLLHQMTFGMTECWERIEYAATSMTMEISRGFFLPIITLLLASLARIYTILLQWQYTIITQYSTNYLSQILLQLNIYNRNTNSNSSNNDIQLLHDRIQQLQQTLYRPLLHTIQQKLSRTSALNAITSTTISTIQRTEMTLQSLGLQLPSSSSSSRKRKRPQQLLSPKSGASIAVTATSTKVPLGESLLSKMEVHDNGIKSQQQQLLQQQQQQQEDIVVNHHYDNDDDADIGQVQYHNRYLNDCQNEETYAGAGDDYINGTRDLDQNAIAVQQFKLQQQQQAKNKPRRSDNIISKQPHCREPTKKVKVKKKSGRNKDNFFDQLFG